MEKNRRSAPRIRVTLQARWEGVLGQMDAVVTDLSRSGCFVLSGGQVELKELIWLQIHVPGGPSVEIWAEVVDQASEIGFAVRFNSTSEDDELRLSNYIEHVLKVDPGKVS